MTGTKTIHQLTQVGTSRIRSRVAVCEISHAKSQPPRKTTCLLMEWQDRGRVIRMRTSKLSNALVVIEKDYRITRKILKYRIRQLKEKCWVDLVRSVDDNPWGKLYRIVLNKFYRPQAMAAMEPRVVRGRESDGGRGVC